MDFHRDTDAPAITLNRTRGVPDAEDTYLMYWHMKRHGEPGKFPIVIPEAARTAPVPSALPKGDSLSADIPAGAYVHVLNPDSPPTFFLPRPGGHILVGQHFCRGSDTLVYWSPLILDPGDRLYLEELTPYQKEKP